MQLTGKRALVIGGGRGVGFAIACSLGAAGANVTIADVDEHEAEAAAAEVPGTTAVRFDATNEEHFNRLRDAYKKSGGVDIVVNNVGVIAAGNPQDIPVQDWQWVFDTNVLSIVRSLKAFLPDMLRRKSGHFVNMTSTAGVYGYQFDRLPYSVSKAGVIALSEGLSLYLRPRGIGVTVVYFGGGSLPEHVDNAARFAGQIVQNAHFHGDVVKPRPPTEFTAVPITTVGDLVVQGIENNDFFVVPNPEVRDILAQRGADLEGFVRKQAQNLWDQDVAAGLVEVAD